VVEVDVGGDDVFGLRYPQLGGGFQDFGDEHSRPGLDDGAAAVPDEIDGEGAVNAGDAALQAVGLVGKLLKFSHS
jgi:hypothetical protein